MNTGAPSSFLQRVQIRSEHCSLSRRVLHVLHHPPDTAKLSNLPLPLTNFVDQPAVNNKQPLALISSNASYWGPQPRRQDCNAASRSLQTSSGFSKPLEGVLQLGPGHALSILAAVGTAVMLSWSWKARQEAAALKKQQEVELSSNTESLRMQIQRLHTCLANDAFVLELPDIKDIDVDPNETPTAQASQLLAAAAGPALPVLEGPMKAEWDRFMASSKISLVQDLWDSHSAVDKPRASLAKLEEMSQRVRNANHSAGSSKAEAARVDPSPLQGKAVSDRRLGRLHFEGQVAVLCSQQPSSRQQDPVSPPSHASRPGEPAETGHPGIHSLQGPHLPQQPNSDHKLQHGIQGPASEGDGASADAMQPAMPGGAAQLVMPSRTASHQAGPEGALLGQSEQARRKQAGTSGSAPSLSKSRIKVVGLSSSSLGALAAQEVADCTTADLHIS